MTIDDFVLPKEVKSPCRCCIPQHAKFVKRYIAYVPLTRNLRLMEQDRFCTLNPEGHDLAVSELDARIKEEGEIPYLLADVSNIADIIAIIRGSRADCTLLRRSAFSACAGPARRRWAVSIGLSKLFYWRTFHAYAPNLSQLGPSRH
jgi:hypothetical protein